MVEALIALMKFALFVALAVIALAISLALVGAVGFLLWYPMMVGWDGMKLFFHNRGWYDADVDRKQKRCRYDPDA